MRIPPSPAIGLLLCLGALGCSSTSEPPTSTPAVPEPSEPEPPEPEPSEFEVDGEPSYYSDTELEALGFTLAPQDALPTREMFGPDGPTPTIEGYTFLCGGEPTRRGCVCRRPLPCAAEGDCITLEENLRVFREAISPANERRVRCERAEVGRCGDFRYFYFQGDTHRYEMRYFDARGVLVAQRNATDYPEYCNHSTDVRWMGRVPRCDRLEREELICGEADRPLRVPVEDLRAYGRR